MDNDLNSQYSSMDNNNSEITYEMKDIELEDNDNTSTTSYTGLHFHETLSFINRRNNQLLPQNSENTITNIKWYHDHDSCRFFLMFFLTGGFFFIEFIWGILSESLALYTDSMHMLSDFLALTVGFYAIYVAKREHTEYATFGWGRMEVVGGLMNSTFLLAICFSICIESIHRFIEGPSEELINHIDQVLIVAVIGLIINLLGLIIFGHGHSHSHSHSHSDNENSFFHKCCPTITNFNIKAVYLHVLGDLLGSIVVIINSIIIKYSSSPYRFLADPICSLVIAFIIVNATIPLVRSTIYVLLQQVPSNVDINKLRTDLESIEGVEEIHDFHVWSLNNTRLVGTLHAIIKCHQDFMKISDKMKLICHGFGIHSTTIQPEFICNQNPSKAPESIDRCHEPICEKEECQKYSCCAPYHVR